MRIRKFRTGGYNVIVATSIGEEGLDIMEVDLVICFDANISPLRMIQLKVILADNTKLKDLFYSFQVSLSGPSFVNAVSAPQANITIDESVKHDCPSLLETKFDAQASVDKVSQHNFQQCTPGISSQRIAHHRFLFGTSFVSVTAVGSICISYVPLLPSSEEAAGFKISVPKKGWAVKTMKQEMTPFSAPSRNKGQNCDAKNAIESHNFACNSPIPSRPDADKHACLTDIKEIVPQAPMVESKSPITLIENATGKNVPVKPDSVMPVSDLKDLELSPRLTNLIERGVVPETPTAEPSNESSATVHVLNASLTAKTDGCSLSIDHLSPGVMVPRCSAKLFNSPECIQNPVSTFLSLGPRELDTFRTPAFDSRTGKRLDMENSEGVSDVRNMKFCGLSAANLSTPTEKHDSKSCSEEWQDIPTSVHQPCKLKRLRKYRDSGKSTPYQTMPRRSNEDGTSLDVGSNRAKSVAAKLHRGKMISRSRANDFFDEEAEVSSDMDVSEDEQEDGEDPENNSFIDDRVNSTIATTQAEASETDMMAFYRRSLLSQSPLECHLNFNGSSPIVTISEGHSLGRDSYEKFSGVSGRSIDQSNSSNRGPCELEEGITSVNALASEVRIAMRKQTEGKIDMRKRKLDYQSVPSLHAADVCIEGNGPVTSRCEEQCPEHENDTVFDDQFYEGLDLDEIEAKAAEMLQRKSELTVQQSAKLESSLNRKEGRDLDVICSPSFDLGV
ncbi:ATP-dependent DNA helicase [Nymphaea thermarum]|nr:ATP-dependent DNA helicase [Nymphaea thermarum]